MKHRGVNKTPSIFWKMLYNLSLTLHIATTRMNTRVQISPNSEQKQNSTMTTNPTATLVNYPTSRTTTSVPLGRAQNGNLHFAPICLIRGGDDDGKKQPINARESRRNRLPVGGRVGGRTCEGSFEDASDVERGRTPEAILSSPWRRPFKLNAFNATLVFIFSVLIMLPESAPSFVSLTFEGLRVGCECARYRNGR